MTDSSTQDAPRFFLAPPWRSDEDFPWYVWAAGWIALLKATVWFFFEPVEANPVLFWKCLIFSLPYLVLASGVWNLKRWAIMGLAGLAVLDLLFLIAGIAPGETLVTSSEFLARPSKSGGMGLLYIGVFFGARLGDAAILVLSPALLKYCREWEAGAWKALGDFNERDGLRYLMAAAYALLVLVLGYSLATAFA